MKTITIRVTRYDLEHRILEGRWRWLDTRHTLKQARTMRELYKTSGLWRREPLRIVKRVVTTVTYTNRKVIE